MREVVVNIETNIPIPETLAQSSSRQNLAAAFIICYISIMFSGISTMLMPVYLPVAVKDLSGNISPEKMNTISAYINSIFIFGSMIGGFAWGFICDKAGRSKTVILSTALYGLFTVLTYFSASWFLVGIYRFITGFGVGGVILTTTILIAEIWPEKNKAVALGIVSAAMPVGFIAAGLLNNLIPDWHHAFLSGIVPLITAVAGLFILQDSSKWKENKESSMNELNKNFFKKVNTKNLVSGSVIFGAMLIGLWAIFSWSPTWAQNITADAEKANQLRGTTTMVLAFAGLGGSIISGWVVNLMGMRKTMMLCFIMCFIMTFVVFKLNNAVSAFTLSEMAILAVFFGISQGALSVFIPYLFPTMIRASATGFCFNIGRVFTATVVFFIGALVSVLGGYGNAIFIFSFVFLIGLASTFLSNEKDAVNEKIISKQ